SWASFSRSTGLLSGTPGSGTAGSYANIRISVTDGLNVSSLPAFSITVTSTQNETDLVSGSPTISGYPPTSVEAGAAYVFVPTASDPNQQPLTFSITNRPAWAGFDAATGRLSGTPAATQVGTYSNVVITASDGSATASLPPFSITVTPPEVSGSAVLTWQPPQQNVDGSALTNLAGYRVRYGQSVSALSQVLDLPSPAYTTVMIEQLASGTWYFGVEAYTDANVASTLSSLVQKLVP
ncbi:MAG TPA: putative Ig domain-containing protein, partial [Steroidobacteraceae bacterium]|nr:putative Ig domain-containing protein [Steroidobacteraceae bacterium]